tara:strand:- start:380 stop:577 length:198 start_codon:yes stop_codon:yes gene_type:complete
MIMTKKFNVDIVIGGSIPIEVEANTPSEAAKKVDELLQTPEKYAEYLELLKDWQALEIGHIEEAL